MVRFRAAVLAAATLAATLTGCASTQPDPGRGLTSTAIPTFTAPVTTSPTVVPGPVRTTTIAAVCGRQAWAVGFTPVDAASGNRFLTVHVRNCSGRTLPVPDSPPITVRDADGKAVAVQWNWRDPLTPQRVPPRHAIYLHLHWLSSGRCERGGASLDVAIGATTAHLADCLQLGGLSDVTGAPTRGDAQWAPAP